MVHYKLTYFNVRGFGEPIRQMFHLAGVEFEDNRFDHSEWEKVKPTTPWGQAPVLSVDGLEIPQSAAIGRYIARKFGFAGKTPEEQAWVDAIVDQFKDFAHLFRKYLIAENTGSSAEEVQKIKETVSIPAITSFLEILNKILNTSTSGFLVGDNVTWADLVIADILTTLHKNGFLDFSDQPKLSVFFEKINSIPQIKAWIEKRPDTQF